MSRIFNRPMFKRGGSAGQGITSGLARPGYAEAGSVDIDEVIRLKEQMKPLYGEPPRGYNTNDFLIDWGLQMASATPQGNVISTGAAAAREPFGKLTKGKADTEMAEYLSDVKATDQALGAVTDIAVARAKARELNKDYSQIRRVEDITKDIMKDAMQGSWESVEANAANSARGTVIINDYWDAGVRNLAKIPNISDSTKFEFDLQSLDPDKIWYDPDKAEWLVVSQVDEEGTTVNKSKSFNSIEEAIKFHTQKKTIDSIDEKKTTPTSEEDTKQTSADINKEKEDYVYAEEDFQVQSSPDAVERAIKKAESGSTEDYDNITNFWKWMASEKDLNDYFKIKEKKIAKTPPGYN